MKVAKFVLFNLISMIFIFATISLASPKVIAKVINKKLLQIPEGKSKFEFDYSADKKLNIWIYKPKEIKSEAQVLFIMHGVKRDAKRYLDEWIPILEKHKMIGVAPSFSKELYPKSLSYNLGNMYDQLNQPRKKEDWSFSVIEPLFDKIRANLSLTQKKYNIYGHSAGAQFVHRFLMFTPEARINKAISANAGWYTLPSFAEDYPYGLAGTHLDETALRKAFSKKLIILLGTKDSDPNAKYLRKSNNSMEQGDNRLDRGIYFFNHAKAQSLNISNNFNWQLEYAQGVGHSNKNMSLFAINFLALIDFNE